MTHQMNPAEYLTKTNTTFLVGDVFEVLTGCNTLASVHVGSYFIDNVTVANMTMGYYSHSVKEFLFNIKHVPDIFLNGTATHQCVQPEIHFANYSKRQYPTVHNESSRSWWKYSYPVQHIMNATSQFLPYHSYEFWVGEPITAGISQCRTSRFDWKIGDKIQSQTLAPFPGGNATKQLLNINDSQSVTNLSLACTELGTIDPPLIQDSGSIAALSFSLGQLLATCLAALVVAFA